jgi:hypothetical protein
VNRFLRKGGRVAKAEPANLFLKVRGVLSVKPHAIITEEERRVLRDSHVRDEIRRKG